MNNSTDVSAIFKPIGKLIHKYHLTLFILCVVGCLVGAVFLLTDILNKAATPDDYTSPISAGTVDQATLDRINALHTSSTQLPEALPSQTRTNPFGE